MGEICKENISKDQLRGIETTLTAPCISIVAERFMSAIQSTASGRLNSRVILTNCAKLAGVRLCLLVHWALTGSPLPFSNIGAPFLPVAFAVAVLSQSLLLFAEIFLLAAVDKNHGGGGQKNTGVRSFECKGGGVERGER